MLRWPAMKGPVSESKMGGILVHANLAANNVRAHRDRLLQLLLEMQPPTTAMLTEVASGLVDVALGPMEMGVRGLSTAIKLAAMNGVGLSLPLDLGVIPGEELFHRLLALRLPRRTVSQAQAFAHVEAAYYAVKSNQEHFVPRCLERLGYPYHAYAATTENLAKIGFSGPDAAATEPTEDCSKIGRPVPPASATGETPQAASVDLDQARAYLDRACTLANLAVKHIDLAVTTISSFTDPNDVADISRFVSRLDNW